MIVRKRGKGKEKGVNNIELKKIVLIQDCRYILSWSKCLTSQDDVTTFNSFNSFMTSLLTATLSMFPTSRFIPSPSYFLSSTFTPIIGSLHYDPVCPSVASVGWSVCLFVGGKFHFHAPIGALINTNFVCSIQLKTGWKQVVWGGRVQNLKQFQFGN